MSARPCAHCKRPAIYFRRQRRKVGRAALIVGAGGGHDLCARCHRDLENAIRAARLRGRA